MILNNHIAAKLLGGVPVGRDRVSCPAPGHRDRHDRSLSVILDPNAPDGFRVNPFSPKDNFQDCRDHVRRMLGLGEFRPGQGRGRPYVAPALQLPAVSVREAVNKQEFARRVWHEAVPIENTPAQRYLLSRGLDVLGIRLDHALRFHPRVSFQLDSGEYERFPCMVAAMSDSQSNEFMGIHRTALAPDGSGKARHVGLRDSRKMLGPSKNAVVRLTEDGDVETRLAIAEGIETSLTALVRYRFPVWATLNAGNMKAFPVLSGIESLVILADNDLSQTGQDAAANCKWRWEDAGAEAEIWLPPTPGTDINDLVNGAKS